MRDDEQESQLFKVFLEEEFDIKELEFIKYFMGIQVATYRWFINDFSKKYTTLNLLGETRKLGGKPI